jgi:hypothetical protein
VLVEQVGVVQLVVPHELDLQVGVEQVVVPHEFELQLGVEQVVVVQGLLEQVVGAHVAWTAGSEHPDEHCRSAKLQPEKQEPAPTVKPIELPEQRLPIDPHCVDSMVQVLGRDSQIV